MLVDGFLEQGHVPPTKTSWGTNPGSFFASCTMDLCRKISEVCMGVFLFVCCCFFFGGGGVEMVACTLPKWEGGQIRGDSLPKGFTQGVLMFYGRIWEGRRLCVGWGVLYRWCCRRV